MGDRTDKKKNLGTKNIQSAFISAADELLG